MKVAIFDFDGTLYEKETFPLLMEQLKSHPIYHKQYNRFYISIIPTYVAHRLRLMSTSRMRTNMMKKYLNVFEGFREEEIIAYYEEIAEVMKEDFNPKVIAALEKHVADGVHVMLVSGAFMPLLKPVVGHLPFDDIIGTEIPYRDGLYDSDGDFLHIQASRKTEVINAALAGKSIDWENSFAYGDSFSDLAVLEMVGNPVAVRPDTRLQALAEKNGWEILFIKNGGVDMSGIYYGTFTYDNWVMSIATTEKGICYIGTPNKPIDELITWAKRKFPKARLTENQKVAGRYNEELTAYLNGRIKHFSAPVDLVGTPFQLSVWQAMCQVAYGQVRTYTDIANAIGRPKAVRAVGAAIGANPVLMVVPCHRVIGKSGSLVGFRAGMDMKVHLLELEGYLG